MKVHDRQVVFSTGKDDWGTPKQLFLKLHEEFNFCVDVCATEENALVDSWIGPKGKIEDALDSEQDWRTACDRVHAASRFYTHSFFMNPPYSNVADFVHTVRTRAEDNKDCRFAMLVAARTDTRWFHEDVLPFASEIRFIKGRVTFAGAPSTAPFPSMVVVYNTATSSKVDGYGAKITSWSYK